MKYSKKAIRQLIEDAIQQVSITLDLTDVSRKTKKAIVQASKDLSDLLRDDLKKTSRKREKLLISKKVSQRGK